MKISNGAKERNLQTGRLGENIAKRYLENNGYRIIEQNYRTRYAEIDLIAKHDNILVFVEVRTKIGDEFGSPEESITRAKVNKLIRNARAYMARKKHEVCSRIDAVCIVLDENRNLKQVNHYKNITF